MNAILFKFFVLATSAVLLVGCGSSKYYLLTSDISVNSHKNKLPEIVETTIYNSAQFAVKTVAVRAPDSCSNRSSDESSGNASSKGKVLQTSCGIEMAEIEKALTKIGYRVISWKEFARETYGQNRSAADIAGKLGAEVIFQINSLEKSRKSYAGADITWDRNYFDSNEYGAQLSARHFDENQRQYLRTDFLSIAEKDLLNLGRRTATLDATAIQVKTGESVWYYNWSNVETMNTKVQAQVLIRCKDILSKCSRQVSESQDRPVTESGTVSVVAEAEDKDSQIYVDLLSAAIDSMVKYFSKK